MWMVTILMIALSLLLKMAPRQSIYTPSSFVTHIKDDKWMGTFAKGGEYENDMDCWPKLSDIDQIKATYLGKSKETKSRIVLSSFNAG